MGTGFSLNYPELDAYIKEATDSEYLTIKEKKSEEKEMKDKNKLIIKTLAKVVYFFNCLYYYINITISLIV